MSTINIEVHNRVAVAEFPNIYSGANGVDSVSVTVDDEWTDFTTKSVIFISGTDCWKVTCISGSAKIPAACLKKARLIKLGVMGEKSTGETITSSLIDWRLQSGASPEEGLSDNDTKTIMEAFYALQEGMQGPAGTGISSVTRYYYRTTSSTKPTSTSGFSATYTAPTASTRYSWAYDKFNFTDGTSQNSGIFQLGVYGETGPAPTLSIGTVSTLSAGSNATAEISGSSGNYSLNLGIPKGQDGTSGSGGTSVPGIESITQYYQKTTSATGITNTSGTWTTTVGTLTSNQWLWTYFKINLDDGTEVSSTPICIGNYNARLSSVSLYQLRNSSTSTPSTTASGWTTSNQEPTSSAPYVWGYLRFTYYPTNGSSSHYVNSNVFRLKTYQAPATSGESAGGMVLESNGCGGWQSGGMNVSGTDILSNVSKGIMPVMYISGFYAPVVCVESTTQDGMDAIRMWYYYGGCSTPTLTNTTVVV